MASSHSIHSALQRLAWSRLSEREFDEFCRQQGRGPSNAWECGTDDCWLEWILKQDAHNNQMLTELGRRSIVALHGAGICLHDRWPRARSAVVQRWLGQRFFISTARSIEASLVLTSIVSSQLGRGARQLANWPELLDWTLRGVARDGSHLLLIAGTTLFEPTVQFAKTARLPCTQMILPDRRYSDPAVGDLSVSHSAVGHPASISAWLSETLRNICAGLAEVAGQEVIYVSPHQSESAIDSELFKLAERDRAAVCLSDRVLALSIRKGGTLSNLLERRLSDTGFPSASVYLMIPRSERKSQRDVSPRSSDSEFSQWLDRGAVGWVVFGDIHASLGPMLPCRNWQSVGREFHQQLCAPAWTILSGWESDWPFLTHCTRALSGQLPQESQQSYFARLWQSGSNTAGHPFISLQRILNEGRLRGSNWMTRGSTPLVSLSAVPLTQLLQRRQFQAHLGRWDWEPYGLMIRQKNLKEARPVNYAPDREYQSLTPAERLYFQPIDSKHDWSLEREWRVPGDIDLRRLPSDSVVAFVRTKSEALQVSRQSTFPVLWTQPD